MCTLTSHDMTLHCIPIHYIPIRSKYSMCLEDPTRAYEHSVHSRGSIDDIDGKHRK